MGNKLVDKGWGAMAVRLDKEMPQKKRKNKLFFFLWIGIGLICSAVAVGYLVNGSILPDADLLKLDEGSAVALLQEEHSSNVSIDIEEGDILTKEPIRSNVSSQSKSSLDVSKGLIKNQNTSNAPSKNSQAKNAVKLVGHSNALNEETKTTHKREEVFFKTLLSTKNEELITEVVTTDKTSILQKQLSPLSSLNRVKPFVSKSNNPFVINFPTEIIKSPNIDRKKPLIYHSVFANVKPNTDFTFVNGDLGYRASYQIHDKLLFSISLGLSSQKSTNVLVKKVDSRIMVEGSVVENEVIFTDLDDKLENAFYYNNLLANYNRYEISLGVGLDYKLWNNFNLTTGLNFYRNINNSSAILQPSGVGTGGDSQSSNLSKNDIRGNIGLKYDVTSKFSLIAGFEASIKPQYAFIVGSKYTKVKRIRNISLGGQFTF